MLSTVEINKWKEKLVSLEHPELVFCALSDQTRFKIFLLLYKASDDICVSEIAEIMEVSSAAVSQHLKTLERAGLITPIRHGQMICYKVRKETEVVKSALTLMKVCGSMLED